MAEREPYWVAMVEEDTNRQQNGRQVLPWTVEQGYATEEQAVQAAWDLARAHRPQHPMSPQQRTVVHHDDYNYTVVVRGATQTFHFRVQVGVAYPDVDSEVVAPRPHDSNVRRGVNPGGGLG